jgi:hypothetical protein
MKFQHDSKKRLRSWVIAAATVAALPSHAATPPTPEQEAVRIAKTLKSIPNDEWKQIAGDKVTAKYDIVKGDTLYDISKRLFGDSKYWPKIWSLNNQTITNPHMIRPGNAISFQAGTGSSLPSVAVVADNTSETPAQPGQPVSNFSASDIKEGYGHPPRSTEWQTLPPQEWENVHLRSAPSIDPLGFDSRSKVKTHRNTGFELPMMAASQKIQALGRIFGSETAGEFIGLGQLVFIHPDGDLQIGQTYSLTDEAEKLESKQTERIGYGYSLLGQVKIVEMREGMYIGQVASLSHPLSRGAILVPLQSKVKILTPIPGPSQLEGVIFMDRQFSTSSVAQHKYVFIDRGSDDGVTPGMVFRSYLHNDPSNSKRITKASIVINADILVVQTSPKFSTGLVTTSYDYITEGSTVTLLTDVSELVRGPVPNQLRLETIGATPPDELDQLDHGNGLTDAEKRELKQLEKWKKTPNSDNTSAPIPESEPLPPPAAEPQTSGAIPPPPPSDGQPQTDAIPPPPASTEVPNIPAPKADDIPPPPTAPQPTNAEPMTTTPADNNSAIEPPGSTPQVPSSNDVPGPPANEPAGDLPPANSESLPPPPPPAQ